MIAREIREAMDAARSWRDRDAFLAVARRIYDLPAEDQDPLWRRYAAAVERLNGKARWVRKTAVESRPGRRRRSDEAA